jgi:hypothetical protein
MLSAIEAVAARNPADLGMRLNVASAQKLAASADRDLNEIAAKEQIDLCRYRLFASHSGIFSVRGVSRSLDTFQEVFSVVFDATADTPKQKARLSKDRYQETALEFGYSFAGSLGVVLIAPGQLSLFGEGKFDRTLDTINSVFDIRDDDELRDTTRRIGKAGMQKIYEWSYANYIAGFSVDLKWLTPSTLQKGRYVEWTQFERVTSLIGRTSEQEATEQSVFGVLVGFDSVSKTFHLVEPNGDSFNGLLAESFPVSRKWTINQPYQADITVEKTTRLATGEEIRRFRLQRLQATKKQAPT